jgi:DNA-binding GntR family transcriptional regulator
MAKKAGSETLAVSVYQQVRFAILNGRFAPGERLKPTELSGRYGVGFGVMREALNLLAAKDLVRMDPNRGWQVTPLSLAALANLIDARKINECAALRLSVARGGVAWESEAIAAHHRMASLPMFLPEDPTSRNEEWAVAHMDFHLTLIEACGNRVLLDICARLSDAAELYRAWSGPGTRATGRDVAGEHKALLDAAVAHDADGAVALLEAHLDGTRAIITDFAVGTQAGGEPLADRISCPTRTGVLSGDGSGATPLNTHPCSKPEPNCANTTTASSSSPASISSWPASRP